MHRLVAVTALGTVLLIAATSATALGLGRVRTSSYLGDPLDLSIAVSADAGDALSPECIRAEVYSGDLRLPDEVVRLRVERSGSGVPVSLRVLTGSRIDEPLARLDLTLNCGTSLTRRYVVFVDPPALELAATSAPIAAAPILAPRGDEPTPAARPRRPRAAERTARQRAGAVQNSGSGGVVADALRSDPPRRSTRAAATVPPAVRTEPASRLQLESAPATAAASPVRRLGSGEVSQAATRGTVATAALAAAAPAATGVDAGSSAASAAVGGLLDQLAAKADAGAAERVRALEADLARARGSNQSLQKSVADLELQLEQARSGGSASLLVYGLAALLLLLLLALAVLAWRRRRRPQASDWLSAAAPADAFLDNDEPRLLSRDPARDPALDADDRISADALDEEPAATASAAVAASSGLRSSGAAAATAPHEITAVHDPRREVSVEELIDLEQQADFFVVLGQDEAAIELLLGHVQGTGGASPLPYLKMLEIHRRCEDRASYDRVRERFNRRFGALAPDWESHSGHGRSLENYPSVVAQLQAAWSEPTLSMQALSALLFKRDEDGQTFDLPAYAELLFLYSMARDLAEHQVPEGGVDLLLPLDEDEPAGEQATAPVPRGHPSDDFTSPADIGLPELRLDSLGGPLDDSAAQPPAVPPKGVTSAPPSGPAAPVAALPADSGWAFDLQLDDDFDTRKPTPIPTPQRPRGRS